MYSTIFNSIIPKSICDKYEYPKDSYTIGYNVFDARYYNNTILDASKLKRDSNIIEKRIHLKKLVDEIYKKNITNIADLNTYMEILKW